MSARIMPLAAAGLLLIGAAPPKQRELAIVSSKIVLPDEDISLDGDADAQLVLANCLGCHSTIMITVQPRMDAAHWAAEVEKMRSAYKAPVSDEDAKRLPAILARQQSGR